MTSAEKKKVRELSAKYGVPAKEILFETRSLVTDPNESYTLMRALGLWEWSKEDKKESRPMKKKNPRSRADIISEMRSVRLRKMDADARKTRLAELAKELEGTPKTTGIKHYILYIKEGPSFEWAGRLEAATAEEAQEEAEWAMKSYPKGTQYKVRHLTHAEVLRQKNPSKRRNPALAGREEWLEHDGKIVTIDGIKHRLKVSTTKAVYPRRETTVSVYASPVNRQSQYYKSTKRKLGDDWSTDVLESPETEAEVMRQLKMKQNPLKRERKKHRLTEKDILHERGSYWVANDGNAYTVVQNLLAGGAESDSSYPHTEDGLSIAKARVDYLARREQKKNPLKRGHSRTTVGKNISTLMSEGYPQKQAIAIALKKAGLSRKKNPSKGWIITDWASNLPFGEKLFPTFEAADSFLDAFLKKEYDSAQYEEARGEYEISPYQGTRETRFLGANDTRSGRVAKNPKSKGKPYKCPDCGSDQDLLAGIMGGVCGVCVRKRHAKATGKRKNPGVRIDRNQEPTVMTASEADKVAKANNASDDDWTYTVRRLDKPKGMAVVEVQDKDGEVLGYL